MIKKHLAKNIHLVGEWFLPNSEEKIPGIFRYESGQIKLELLRTINGVGEAKTVHGITPEGKVTLVDVMFQDFGMAEVRGAVFGHHMIKNNVIKHATFSFDLLSEWAVSKHPLEFLHDTSEWFDYMQKTTETFDFEASDCAKCTLTIFHDASFQHIKGIKMHAGSYFTIKSKQELSLQNLVQDYIYGIKYFLMVVMGRNLILDELHLEDGSTKCPIYVSMPQKLDHGNSFEYICNIGHVRENYEKILTKWFEFYKKNKALLDLFFVSYENHSVNILDFFVYAAVLEGFHKSTLGLDPRTYPERIRNVLEQFFVNDFVNLDEFVDEIVRLRCDLFHLNRRDEFEYEKLFHITHDLQFIIRLVFLNYVGCCATIDSRPAPINFKFLKRK